MYSYDREYSGQSWLWGYGFMKPTLECDKALIAEYGGVKYGLSTLFEKAMDNENKDVVIQYEVRYQKGLECGGAYLKVFGEGVLSSPEDLRDSTPYVLMFGPDYCGKTNRVHVRVSTFWWTRLTSSVGTCIMTLILRFRVPR